MRQVAQYFGFFVFQFIFQDKGKYLLKLITDIPAGKAESHQIIAVYGKIADTVWVSPADKRKRFFFKTLKRLDLGVNFSLFGIMRFQIGYPHLKKRECVFLPDFIKPAFDFYVVYILNGLMVFYKRCDLAEYLI